jgi:prophage regulatory protein
MAGFSNVAINPPRCGGFFNGYGELIAMYTTDDFTILRMKDLVAFIGLSRSKIYEMLDHKSKRHDPAFPKQVRLGTAAVGWYRGEVIAWLHRRRQQS